MGTTALLVSNFYSSVGNFSVLALFLSHMNYISFDVLYVLPSVKFKDSYYVSVVDNFLLRSFSLLCISRSAGGGFWSFVYYCLNRDNAKRGLFIYRESFDTYVENVMPGCFSLDQFATIIKHWSNPS